VTTTDYTWDPTGLGKVVGIQDYDAFGATRDQAGVQLPFTYTGEQVDPDSGLVYLRNRYPDPTTGRCLTPDPLGFAGSVINLYEYVANRVANAHVGCTLYLSGWPETMTVSGWAACVPGATSSRAIWCAGSTVRVRSP
jgi:RHS repeat-associated protein